MVISKDISSALIARLLFVVVGFMVIFNQVHASPSKPAKELQYQLVSSDGIILTTAPEFVLKEPFVSLKKLPAVVELFLLVELSSAIPLSVEHTVTRYTRDVFYVHLSALAP